MSYKKRILWLDEEPIQIEDAYNYLVDSGYSMQLATSTTECFNLLSTKKFDAIILDVMMPHGDELSFSQTKGGTETGISMARMIQNKYPNTIIIGCSVHRLEHVRDWFNKFASGFIPKEELYPLDIFENKIKLLIEHGKIPPKAFIVHGHANEEKLALKNYLQNTLEIPEPIILHERPNLGRTIIEKFEEETKDVDLVFVLLTPDDIGTTPGASNEEKRRARQNVIFEMGFFFAKMQRKSGRVILLYKGYLELPSDISGIIYIDITQGIEESGEKIRKELVGLL